MQYFLIYLQYIYILILCVCVCAYSVCFVPKEGNPVGPVMWDNSVTGWIHSFFTLLTKTRLDCHTCKQGSGLQNQFTA